MLLTWEIWVCFNKCVKCEIYASFCAESNIANRNRELKIKDESIAMMEKIIQEKSNAIAVLQSNVELLQV